MFGCCHARLQLFCLKIAATSEDSRSRCQLLLTRYSVAVHPIATCYVVQQAR
jgi:hypothetical protein